MNILMFIKFTVADSFNYRVEGQVGIILQHSLTEL